MDSLQNTLIKSCSISNCVIKQLLNAVLQDMKGYGELLRPRSMLCPLASLRQKTSYPAQPHPMIFNHIREIFSVTVTYLDNKFGIELIFINVLTFVNRSNNSFTYVEKNCTKTICIFIITIDYMLNFCFDV